MRHVAVVVFLFSFCFALAGGNDSLNVSGTDNGKVEWIASNFLEPTHVDVEILGSPGLIDSPYGKAVFFDGESDGIIIRRMPEIGSESFTIEAVFFPSVGGQFEQRFLHFGEAFGSRILFETRSDDQNWYFDAHYQTPDEKITLIDSTLQHPLGMWCHVALVNKNGILTTYVNGQKEVERSFNPSWLGGGQTSLGVRLNQVSWFRGAIYGICISSEALTPQSFHYRTNPE